MFSSNIAVNWLLRSCVPAAAHELFCSFWWPRPVSEVNAHPLLLFPSGFPRLTQLPLSESGGASPSPALDFHPGGSAQVFGPL